MNIVGSNLFLMASRLIARQNVFYWKSKGRTINEIGFDITEYETPIIIQAGVQPLQMDMYQKLGLDFQKRYYTVYFSADVMDINRDVSGDQLGYAGRQLQSTSGLDWFHLDGWKSVLMVDIGEIKPYYPIFGFEGEGYMNFDNGNFGNE